MSGSSEPSPLAPWKEGDPRADEPLPAVTLAKISTSSGLFLRMGAGWPQAECTLPTLSGTVLAGVGTSQLLPSDEHKSQRPLTPVQVGQELGTPLAASEGVQQKLEEREVGGGVGSEFPVLLPAPPPPAHTRIWPHRLPFLLPAPLLFPVLERVWDPGGP